MGGSREARDGGWGMALLVELGLVGILVSFVLMFGIDCS